MAAEVADPGAGGALPVAEAALPVAEAADPVAEAALPVAFVSSHAGLGGSERYLEALLAELPPRWCSQVTVLAQGPLVGRLQERGLPVAVLEVSGSRLAVPAAVRQLRALLPPTGAVHANGVKAALLACLALRDSARRLVWVKHDFSFDGPLTRLIARRCARVVGVSSAVLKAVDGVTATCVVPPGLAPAVPAGPMARSQLRRLVGAGADASVIALVGRLDPAKGCEDLLRALPAVRAALPSVQLALVGGADPAFPGYADRLTRAAATLGLDGAVHLTGHRPDARTLIAGADAVVVASRATRRSGMGQEGFGLVALEALAAGTPVVGYRGGALDELVGDAGLLVGPGDTAGLAAALVRLLRDPELAAALVARGRARARAHPTPQQTAARMCEIYRQLDSGGLRSSR